MEAKFLTADVAGWQTGYAFDFNRGVPGALSDTTGQRRQFLDSAAALRAQYASIGDAALNGDERALLRQASQSFESFMQTDQRIMQVYRIGTPVSIKAGNDLASGESLEAFGKAATATSDLAAKAAARGMETAASAAASAQTGKQTMILAGVMGLLLSVLVAWIVIRSISGPLRALQLRLTDIADGDGDLWALLTESGRDELTAVARSFNKFVASIAEAMRSVDERSHRLAGKSQQLTVVSSDLATSAEETRRRAGTASSAAEQISASVHTVAAGAEEMAPRSRRSPVAPAKPPESPRTPPVSRRRLPTPSTNSASPAVRSATSPRSSVLSPNRRTCWPSTRPSRPPAPVNRARASPWWPARSKT